MCAVNSSKQVATLNIPTGVLYSVKKEEIIDKAGAWLADVTEGKVTKIENYTKFGSTTFQFCRYEYRITVATCCDLDAPEWSWVEIRVYKFTPEATIEEVK